MVIVSYRLNGKIYDLPEDEVDGFLKEFPSAILIQENETAGKGSSSRETESTAAEESIALEPTVTDSTSEDTLSELSEIEVPQVKTGTVADTQGGDEIYEEVAGEAEKHRKHIINIPQNISSDNVNKRFGEAYFGEQVFEPIQETKYGMTSRGNMPFTVSRPRTDEEIKNILGDKKFEQFKSFQETGKIEDNLYTDSYERNKALALYEKAQDDEILHTATRYIEAQELGTSKNIINIYKDQQFKTPEEYQNFVVEQLEQKGRLLAQYDQFNEEVPDYEKDVNLYNTKLGKIRSQLNVLDAKPTLTKNESIQYNNLVEEYNSTISSTDFVELAKTSEYYSNMMASIERVDKALLPAVENFNNLKILSKALTLNYDKVDALGNYLEEFFAGNVAVFGAQVLQTLAAGSAYGKGSSVLTAEQRKNIADSNASLMVALVGKAVDYQSSFATEREGFPPPLELDDIGKNGIDFYDYALNTAIQQSGSIVTYALPAAVLAKGASGLNAARKIGGETFTNFLKKKAADGAIAMNTATSVFFATETGGARSSFEIEQRNARLQLGGLLERYKNSSSIIEKQELFDKITLAVSSLEWSVSKKAAAAYLSGAVASAAERIGGMTVLQGFKAISPSAATGLFNKAFQRVAVPLIKTPLVENAEEAATVVGQKAIGNVVLDKNDNVFEDLTADFAARNTITSLIIGGKANISNIQTLITSELITQQERKDQKILNRKLDGLVASLEGLDGRTKEYKKIVKEIQNTTEQMGVSEMLASIKGLSAEQLKKVGALNVKLRAIIRERAEVLRSGESGQSTTDALSRLSNQAALLEKEKEIILTQPVNDKILNIKTAYEESQQKLPPEERESKEMQELRFSTENIAELKAAYAAYILAEEVARTLLPKNGQYIKLTQENYTEDGKNFTPETIELLKGAGITTTAELAGLLTANGMNQGDNIIINERNINKVLLEQGGIGSLDVIFSAQAPLHELAHINNRNKGIRDTNGNILGLQEGAIEDIKKEIELLKNNNLLSGRDYQDILRRIEVYTKDKKVDQEELMLILGDLKSYGLLPPESFSLKNSIKLLLNSIQTNLLGEQAGPFFKLKTSEDVLRYIDSYVNSLKANSKILLSEEEEDSTIKESKSLTSGVTTDAENITKESKTESIRETLDKIDQVNPGAKDKKSINENKFKSKEEFRNSPQWGEVLQKMLAEEGLFDGLIINKSGIDFTARNPQEAADFIENVKGDLIKRFAGKNNLGNFDPTKNSLFGYFTGNKGLIANAIKNVKKDFAEKDIKTRSLDVEAGEIGSVREIGTEEEIDMDEFMARTDAENESDATKLTLIAKVLKTPDGKKIPKLKETIETKVTEKGPKLTDKELTYKTSPDYGTPAILKGINDWYQNTPEFIKIYEEKARQLDRDIAAGKTTRDGQKINKASQLQQLKIDYTLRPKDFAGSGNLSQKKFPIVKKFIEENIDVIVENLPRAAVTRQDPVSKKIENTSTGVPNNFLNNNKLYTKTDKTIGQNQLVVYEKNKNIKPEDILEMLEGKPLVRGEFGLPMQNAKQFVNNLGQFATNQELRLQKFITPQQSTNLEGGKDSRILFSKNMSREIRENLANEIIKIKDNFDKYKGLTNDIIDKVIGVLEENKDKTYNQVFNEIKNITSQTLSLVSQREFDTTLLNSLLNLSRDGKVKEDIITAFETYRKLFRYEQRKIGYNFATNYLNLEFNEAKGDKAKQKVVKDFLKYISRSIRTLKIDGITTNEVLFNQIIKPLLEKNNNLGFKVYKDENNNRTYITFNGDRLTGLQDITEIKKDFGGNVETIKAEAEETLNYYKKIIDQAKAQGTVEQIKGFIALTSADQRGMLRKLSTPGFEIKAPGEKMVLEHETTALELFNKLVAYADGKIEFPALQKFVSQAKVNLIPKTLDKILNAKGYTGDGKSRYNAEEFLKVLQQYKDQEKVIDYSVDAKGLIRLSKSIYNATVKNNLELPKSQRLSKGSTNEQVLAKMQELDDEANEARIKFSKSQGLDDAFNDIIEAKTGIETYKRFSPAKAAVRGASKGKFNFFIPPSAEDFVGLLYKTLAKGKVGDRQMQWYKDNLLDPYARAMNDISSARVALFEDYKTLKKDLKIIPKDLKKKGFDEYTNEQAVRVYIWDKQGDNIPGLYKTDRKELVGYINSKPELKLFADQLIAIQKGDQYSKPKEGWLVGTITTDLLDGVNSIKRKKYLEQWQTNADEIFSPDNMNKLEAAFGKPYRGALENMLTRMKTGRNKPFTSDSLAGRVTDWLNNSVGAIMFFNTRSAVLQTISSINFINWSDNNIYKAGKAFANQPQYWKDFKFLFNSDFLKERRGGLRFNVSESEIADAAKKGGVRGVISKILQSGFLPTQMADSFAIATGGATFYRNRVNAYVKQGMDVKEAQDKAFQDFREIAEESQQSSRPDRISAQQAGPLGRTILSFANTPAQYARLTKKAASDLINGRGDAKTNISKLLYYGAVQNLIFNALQQALFAVAFGDGEDEKEERNEKYFSVANGMADGLLRGIGLQGAIISTLKNTLLKIIKESEKSRPDYAETAMVQLLGISPPIQSKAQKIRSAMKSYEWNKKEMLEKGFSLDNPAYLAGANVISASTNVPLDRVIKKVDNISTSTQEDIQTWQRMMLLAGWSDWQLGIQKSKKEKKKKKSKLFIP